mmetsp:Transcript_32811/g.67235  ORF Transcript_32811/g.67235 Transcript_32811/m.67235 type:complete len:175 (-) Transcript_32811:83-607(-)
MAGDSFAPERGDTILPEITDEVADRLFRSLELIEADYQRTLAAEPRQRETDEEEDEDEPGAGYAALGSDDGGSEEEAADADWGAFQQSEDVWTATSDPDSQLESFADFGATNPALPAPPEISLLQAKLLSRDEIRLIKETMQQIQLPTPSWAQRLSDRDFQRMVQDSLRSAPTS